MCFETDPIATASTMNDGLATMESSELATTIMGSSSLPGQVRFCTTRRPRDCPTRKSAGSNWSTTTPLSPAATRVGDDISCSPGNDCSRFTKSSAGIVPTFRTTTDVVKTGRHVVMSPASTIVGATVMAATSALPRSSTVRSSSLIRNSTRAVCASNNVGRYSTTYHVRVFGWSVGVDGPRTMLNGAFCGTMAADCTTTERSPLTST